MVFNLVIQNDKIVCLLFYTNFFMFSYPVQKLIVLIYYLNWGNESSWKSYSVW